MNALTEADNWIICTFGGMMRFPGSNKTQLDSKISGIDIRVLYSSVNAAKLAEDNHDKEIIYLSRIGFVTIIPILNLMVGEAENRKISNFSV